MMGFRTLGILVRKHPRPLRDPRRSPSVTSTNNQVPFKNDGGQPSPFALWQKRPKTTKVELQSDSHGKSGPSTPPGPSLWATWVEPQPQRLPHNFGLPRKTSSSAMLGEKSVKCMHPKSRCSQNPQKCFILAGNDSDFRFSNFQSGFGRA